MKRSVSAIILTFSLLAGLSTPVYATGNGNPAGNNGVVKVNDEVVSDTIPNNDPHVSCKFNVEFYNYDKNNSTADVSFALQAPTNKSGDKLTVSTGNLHPFIGGDAAGGGTDLDARESYTLNFTGTPQANQGYHVKLTVDAPGSKGSTKKSKVFWVQPCAQTNQSTPQVLGEGTTNPTSETSGTDSETVNELPNTGAGNIIGLFAGVSVLAGFGHYILRSCRLHS